MSASGFVLVRVQPARRERAVILLRGVEGVAYAEPLDGEYDAIARVDAEDFDGLGRIVIHGIRSLEGVLETKTLTVARL